MIDRYVVPIYNIKNTENFELENSIDNITYKISLKTYSRHNCNYAYIDEKELGEVFKYGSITSVHDFYKILEHDDTMLHKFTKTLLVIDFERKDENHDFSEILYSILDSFHLSISKGISYYKYFSFKSYSANSFFSFGGTSTLNFGQTFISHTLHSKPYNFSPMVREKLSLTYQDFKHINKLILYLYKLYTMKENQYSKIIKLSLDYHKLSRTFEKVEQAFLTLMICIESMFKKSDNLWKDTPNIAKLLSETKSDYENILYKFKKNKSNPDFNKYYIEVRNSIAHGDDLLPTDEIKIKVLELHEYIRKCIIKILDINDEFELVNYYEDLFTCIEKKWQNIKM